MKLINNDKEKKIGVVPLKGLLGAGDELGRDSLGVSMFREMTSSLSTSCVLRNFDFFLSLVQMPYQKPEVGHSTTRRLNIDRDFTAISQRTDRNFIGYGRFCGEVSVCGSFRWPEGEIT